MVFELLPAGTTKASAIHAFLKELPFRGRRPIFIGDDVTDEQALHDVERMGGSVRRGRQSRGAMLRVSVRAMSVSSSRTSRTLESRPHDARASNLELGLINAR